MAKAYLVVRIKGQADVPHWANTTLNLLKLEKKYRAVILPVKDNTVGMLKKYNIIFLGRKLILKQLKNYWTKKAEELVTKKSRMKIFHKQVLKQLMIWQYLCQKGKPVCQKSNH